MRRKRTYHSVLGTGLTSVYLTPPRFESDITSILVANVGTTATTFDISYFEAASGITHEIVKNVTLSRGQVVQITNPLFTLVNDRIEAKAGTGGTIKLTVAVDEQPAYTI